MNKTCKVCNKEKDVEEYHIIGLEGKYRSSTCKSCISIKKKSDYKLKRGDETIREYIKSGKYIKREPKEVWNYNITKDDMKRLKYLLHKIDIRKGGIDEVDAFNILSYFIEIFGTICYPGMNSQMELDYMYNELLEYTKDVK